MKFIQPFLLLSFLFTLSLWSANPVPYSGKIDIHGVNYFGEAQFAFSLHDGNGTTHWRNGNQPKETIKVTIRNGRYSVLLGGQGMNSLPPELFLNHDKLYLKVEVDMEDGEGLRHLAPDQLITATPRALVADIAKVAQVAQTVSNGAITRDMLSSEVLAKLDANSTASPSAPSTITRDMLPKDVRDDLNKTLTITRSMLPADVLADLNKSSSSSSPITLSMLAPEVTAKLDQNGSGGSGVVAGSLISIPYGQSPPAGYSLYQRGEPKTLVWEEKAPVSVARYASDGVEFLDGKIYFVGGGNGSSAKNIVERYDPETNTWKTLNSMSVARSGVASAVLNGKLYAIGGTGLSSVEVYDPNTGNWTAGVDLPSVVNKGTAITVNNKIYLVGGRNASDQIINQVLSFDLLTNQWTAKADMPTARFGPKLVWFQERIWAISFEDIVESYDPVEDSWQTEASLSTNRNWPVAWQAYGILYVAGGYYSSQHLSSIEAYDPVQKSWSITNNLPEKKREADAVVLNGVVYVVAGDTGSNTYSNKVFAADLNASVVGVYDLYRKDGNASAGTPLAQAEVADGSVTASKMANNSITTTQLSEQILKYLKPEITTQPQAQTVYADNNVSFSVTAEGKYLTYQWKKDDSNLTGETNATLTITDANATLHDGNYSVVVSNDFGSVESVEVEVLVDHAGPINGLVAWWKFDETNGTVAYDSSGNGYDGNLIGGSTWATGKIGGAISLDGTNDYVEVSSRKWNIENLFSVSFWYLNNGADGTIFSLGTPSNNNEIMLWILEGRQDFYFHKELGNWARIYEPTLSQDWHHKTCVVNGGYLANQMFSYINGSLHQSTYKISGVPGLLSDLQNRLLRIGSRVNASKFFNGLIDDVRIYDRALSAEEVQALYNMGQ
jgi:hypothetical protein